MFQADSTEHGGQAEEVLRATARSWRAVFDNSSVGVALTDSTGRYLAVNVAYEKMLGYTSDELRSMTWREMTHPEDLAANELLINELLEGKRDRYELEKRCFRKNGGLIWVRVNGAIVAQGDSRFAVTIVEDVNERKRLGEELEREQRRLRLLLDLYGKFASKLDLREFFDAVTEGCCEIEGWEYAFVCIAESSGDSLWIRILHDQWSGLVREGAILRDGTAIEAIGPKPLAYTASKISGLPVVSRESRKCWKG